MQRYSTTLVESDKKEGSKKQPGLVLYAGVHASPKLKIACAKGRQHPPFCPRLCGQFPGQYPDGARTTKTARGRPPCTPGKIEVLFTYACNKIMIKIIIAQQYDYYHYNSFKRCGSCCRQTL